VRVKKIDTCIFDFDGTLVDSRKDIQESLQYAFNACKVPARTVDAEIMMQLQLRETVEAMAPGIADEVIKLVMGRFKERYDASGFPNTLLLPAVAEGLEKLKEKSVPCYIVSNKRQFPMEKILDKLDIRRYFAEIFNPDMYDAEKRMTKTALLAHALEKHRLHRETSAYIGDMEADVVAAKANGLIAIAVKNGYGNVEGFTVKPDFAVADLGEIAGLIDGSQMASAPSNAQGLFSSNEDVQ
jgi:phosphoglycolate phosphatase